MITEKKQYKTFSKPVLFIDAYNLQDAKMLALVLLSMQQKEYTYQGIMKVRERTKNAKPNVNRSV